MSTESHKTTSTHTPMFSHVGPNGEARMVDVSDKPITTRQATASARLTMRIDVLNALLTGQLKKGETLNTARIAGIQAAKRTGEWIPMCHPLPLDHIHITYAQTAPNELLIVTTARTTGRTGVEMEAMVGASAAALTIYDMSKSADKSIVIGPIQLEHKSGGKSGIYNRKDGT